MEPLKFLRITQYFAEDTYRIPVENITGIPPIPIQPIGFEDAYILIWFVMKQSKFINPKTVGYKLIAILFFFCCCLFVLVFFCIGFS